MTRKKDKPPDIQGELIGQLGYPKHLPIVLNTGNSRNGHGMSVRDMQAMLLELYQVEVSESLISSGVTDAVLDNVRAWQSRSLEAQRAENQRLIPD